MSSFHLFNLVGMTRNQITLLLLKILIIAISLIDLMLKGSNFIFMLSFELFPFLFLFLDKKVMLFNLSLELDLFLAKLFGKTFAILQKILMCFLKLCDIYLEMISLGFSLQDFILKRLLVLVQDFADHS
jgi:hypothetical protein